METTEIKPEQVLLHANLGYVHVMRVSGRGRNRGVTFRQIGATKSMFERIRWFAQRCKLAGPEQRRGNP